MSSVSTPPPSSIARRFRLRRALAGLWMATYALFTVVLPILDAERPHDGRIVVHIEDAENPGCAETHGPDCAICHWAPLHRALPAEACPSFALECVTAGAAPTGIVLAAVAVEPGGLSSRGPPAA